VPFLIALALSAALHVAAVALPGWDLPGQAEGGEPAVVEAHLVPPKAAAPPLRQEAEKPKPRPHAHPHSHTASAAVPALAEGGTPAAEAPAPAPVVAAPPAPPPPAPSAPPPPPVPPWGSHSRIVYSATYGTSGFVIGETRQEFTADGGHYVLHSSFAPKGLAALRGRTRAQDSSGEIAADGLRPGEFRDQREGRDAESAALDWTAAKVTFSGSRGQSALPTGAQDLLSVFYQLAWLMPRQNLDLAVATAGRVGRWTFEYLGEETLNVSAVELATLHLRTRADGDMTEVWLATGRGGLPVKIRYTDRNGDVFEQVATQLEIN
jgi:hypothetical protein